MNDCLNKNPFYKIILTKNIFHEASEKCWLICIPTTKSLKDASIDDQFIGTHLLKPSPLLLNHFLPSNRSDVIDVELENQKLVVQKKGKIKEIINILSEEIAYNSVIFESYLQKSNKFRILIIEKPLISLNLHETNETIEETQDTIISTFLDCQNFLNRISPEIVLCIQEKTEKLKQTYLLLPGYLEDAKQKYRALIDWAIEKYYGVLSKSTELETIHIAVESYVIGLAHAEIFKAVNIHYETEDRKLENNLKIIKRKNLSLESLGAQNIFKKDYIDKDQELIDSLTNLNSKRTPLEKLYCLKQILDFLNRDLSKCIVSSPFEKGSEKRSVMSDDLVASLIYILSVTSPILLMSNLQFINQFNWNLPSKNELGYSLVTFEVALGFIKSLDSSDDGSQSNGSKIKENKSEYKIKYRKTISQVDYELERATKLLSSPSNSVETENVSHHQDNELGDFLSSLCQANMFMVSSGKQN